MTKKEMSVREASRLLSMLERWDGKAGEVDAYRSIGDIADRIESELHGNSDVVHKAIDLRQQRIRCAEKMIKEAACDWHIALSKARLRLLLTGREPHMVPTGFDVPVRISHEDAMRLLESERSLRVFIEPGYALIERIPEDDEIKWLARVGNDATEELAALGDTPKKVDAN